MTEHEERQLEEMVEERIFLRDKRHLRFEETPENFAALGRFLDEHSLPVTAANLHRAYEDLAERGELELTPLATVAQHPIPQVSQAPVPQAEPDEARLHTVERRPGESSWMAVRRAFAEQQIAEQRKARQQMRAEVQSAPTRKNSREINNQFAALRKPRGKGAAVIIENGE